MFTKILVANRGEIAVRIMHTLREMEIVSVAVYSDADKKALHVASADEALYIGDSAPSESYLNIEKIIDAALKSGAEAIHPGYGFLSENAEFAQAVVDAGLVFIGPPAEVIATLGDKITARKMMQESDVPVAPGLDNAETDLDILKDFAKNAGYPVLVKASAGGGGKGMRIVHSEIELAEAIALASSEAKAAFGNGAVFLEKYIEKPRHVEIQVMADNFGNAIHLNERECSIQRRHQKIIEETPSPALNEELRQQMGQAAVKAVQASGYIGAGTVEFLLDATGKFYFLEVNTRLQVEHPITEMTTGVDLVKMQVMVADNQQLSIKQNQIKSRGHAIECRIYAEDAEDNFMPCPGTVLLTKVPVGPGIRLDTGIYSGAEVPMYYDPIMSKLIVHAETRPDAIAKMTRALSECVVLGVKTSIAFMMEIINSPAFVAGETQTHFIEEHFSDWKPEAMNTNIALAGFTLENEFASQASVGLEQAGEKQLSPWQRLGKWDLC